MEIEAKEMRRVFYVAVKGRVDVETAPQLASVLDKAMEEGHYRFVLDLNDLEYISSSGLRTLIRVRKEVRRYNRGDLRLAAMPPRIRQVFDLAGLLPLFPIYDDAVAAVGSF